MKSRLTITLAEDILGRVDRLIDGREIRNRSHAIEQLIHKSLAPTVTSAVILAGGKAALDGGPTALIPIDGQPLLFIMLSHLRRFGVRQVLVCAGPWQAAIRDVLGWGEATGVAVQYLKEPRPLGTAGALKHAGKFLPPEPFLVIHGDVLTTLNLEEFISFHETEKTRATIAVKPRLAEQKYGKVLLEGNRITDFIGKEGDRGISIVNTGLYLFNPEVLSLLPSRTPASLEKDVFPKLAKLGELGAYLFQGLWFDVSRPPERKEAIARWRREKHS